MSNQKYQSINLLETHLACITQHHLKVLIQLLGNMVKIASTVLCIYVRTCSDEVHAHTTLPDTPKHMHFQVSHTCK
jgi:hypothetical protein